MISQTTNTAQQVPPMNPVMSFDEEEQHYQRIIEKISECQGYPGNGFDVFDVFADQEITTMMHELQKLDPNSPEFNAKWQVAQNTIIILQSWKNRVHGTTFTRFSQHPRVEKIQIQAIMQSYISEKTQS